MENKMTEYLGEEYSDDPVINVCRYWLKGLKARADYDDYDSWRKVNDLDCLYFDGALEADTLMSPWSPLKWVADCLNKDEGKTFQKPLEKNNYYTGDLELLIADADKYLPPDIELVKLLKRFLSLSEKRCNYILLPERDMNPHRFMITVNGRQYWFCDEVPATLWHVFEKDTLGRYFLDDTGEVDVKSVTDWIVREKLQMGFKDGVIAQKNVLSLISGLHPSTPKWLRNEDEIKEALTYMICFLELHEIALKKS